MTCGGEVFFAFVWAEGGQAFSDPGPKALDGSLSGVAQEGLEFGEGVLDRIEVGTVGRKIEKPSASGFDGIADAYALVRSEVVHDDDISGLEFRDEELIDIGLKR
jgi:hypothetical protein